LTDIFDSGLRPYRDPGLENLLLEFKHCRLTVERRSGVLLPELAIEHAQMHVLREGLIEKIELTSAPFTMTQARDAMEPYLKMGYSTETELNAYLNVVKDNPMNYDATRSGAPESPGGVWEDQHGPQGSVHFRASRVPEAPLRIRMGLYWTRTSKQNVDNYRIPIPPPPGYENVSMEAPKNFGPDPVSLIRQGMGIKEKEYNYPGPTERALSGDPKFAWLLKEIQEKEAKSDIGSVAKIEQDKPFPWWYLIASVAVVALLGRYLIRRKSVDL